MSEKKSISIQGVLNDLEAGLERDDIKAKLGLSHSEMKVLFSHPKLKHKKTKKPVSFDIIDDVPDTPKRQSSDTVNRKRKPAQTTEQVAATASTAKVEETANLNIQDDTEKGSTVDAGVASAPVQEVHGTIKEVQTEEDKEDTTPSSGVGLW